MQVKGFTRQGTTIVNTEKSELEAIRLRRAQKKVQDQTSGEVTLLREMVASLTERVRKLEERNG